MLQLNAFYHLEVYYRLIFAKRSAQIILNIYKLNLNLYSNVTWITEKKNVWIFLGGLFSLYIITKGKNNAL